MKTCNKFLLGAFIIIVIIMVIANIKFKQKADEIKAKQEIYIQETDSVKTDSTSSSIKIQIN
jgi:hypothetical protein